MTEQTLPGFGTGVNAMAHKVFPNVLDASRVNIDHAAWLRAVAEGKFVATCRRCGHYCKPEAPVQVGGRFDYEAVCINDTPTEVLPRGCQKTVAIPGGRLMPKSTRDRERPQRD